MKLPNPPKDISTEAAAIWRRLHREYRLTDEAAVQIVVAGLRAFDTARKADAILLKDGLMVTDRYGTPKVHPCADVARSARAQWLQALRLLGLNEVDDGDEA